MNKYFINSIVAKIQTSILLETGKRKEIDTNSTSYDNYKGDEIYTFQLLQRSNERDMNDFI